MCLPIPTPHLLTPPQLHTLTSSPLHTLPSLFHTFSPHFLTFLPSSPLHTLSPHLIHSFDGAPQRESANRGAAHTGLGPDIVACRPTLHHLVAARTSQSGLTSPPLSSWSPPDLLYGLRRGLWRGSCDHTMTSHHSRPHIRLQALLSLSLSHTHTSFSSRNSCFLSALKARA